MDMKGGKVRSDLLPLPHSRRNNEGGEECVVMYMCASAMAGVNSQVTTTLLAAERAPTD